MNTSTATKSSDEMVAGHDDQPPEFRTRREAPWVEGRKEPTDSPENINHSRITWLYAHNRITERMYQAADILAKVWELSLIQPRASSVMVGGGSSGGDNHPNDTKVDAMRRHGKAKEALGRLWPIVELVVERNVSTGRAAEIIGIHEKAAMGLLRIGLDTLADHYRMPEEKN